MTYNEYKEKAQRTLPNLAFLYDEKGNITNTRCDNNIGLELNLCHMMLGLGSEIAELTECVGTELKQKVDRVNLGEELGDIYWYITNYCTIRNLPVPEDVKVDLPNDTCFELLITSIGNLTNLVKRFVAYHQEIPRAKELEIIYNVYAALKLFENVYDLEGEIVRKKNIHKLMVRYPDKYSDSAAINRDTTKENEVL